MAKKVVRDLIGDPATWENHISDGAAMADMVGATILDILVSGSQLAIYTRSAAGMEALSVFFIDDSGTSRPRRQGLIAWFRRS